MYNAPWASELYSGTRSTAQKSSQAFKGPGFPKLVSVPRTAPNR
jgi:hypothetical protein